MKYENINPKDIIFSLDIGTRSIIGTVGVVRDKKFTVIGEKYIEHEERAMIDGQIHDITQVANAVKYVKYELEKELNVKLSEVAIAAAGRFLRTTTASINTEIDPNKEIDKEVIRSLELTAVKNAEDEVNGNAQGKLYCVGYSVKSYYLNGFVISNLLAHKGESIGIDVIATFLPRSVVDSLYAVMKKAELEVISLTLEPIAAIEAVIPQSLRLLNLALVDIGAGTSDIAISSKDSICAYGMVPMAGDEVTEVIAQALLVDFNTAERIKKECSIKDEITYVDVLGLENCVSKEEILKIISPTVEKVSDEISKGIIDLNGGKAPNAVFLVGGGAHTPGLKDILATKLNLPPQRIAVKGREAITDCVCLDNELGSIGVTVLGIALVSIKRRGNDFINVMLNDTVVSLFNSRSQTVIDVLMQAGVNPKLLMGKNGKNIKFNLNGIKRVAFGSLAKGSTITINNLEGTLESEVGEGDIVKVVYAEDGKEASPKVCEYLQKVASISFFFNDRIHYLEPVAFINNEKVDLESTIKENDEVLIVYPETLGDFKKYYLSEAETEDFVFYMRDKQINNDYNINEGDRIYSKSRESIEYTSLDNVQEDEIKLEEIKSEEPKLEQPKVDDAEINNIESKDLELGNVELETPQASEKNIKKIVYDIELEVVVNGKPVTLKGKGNYVFIDIFDFIDFDLTYPKGNLVLEINGQKAGYHDALKSGDIIKVCWE